MKKTFVAFIATLTMFSAVYAEDIPVRLNTSSKITTSDGSLQEGDLITLVVSQDVFVNSKLLIKKGELATGVVTNLENNDFTAQPASIYAEHFRTKDVNGQVIKLNGVVYKSGRSHAYATQYIGSGFQLIRGGEAIISPQKDKFILYLKETTNNNKKKKELIDAL